MKRRAVVTVLVAISLFVIAATIRSGWLYLVASALAGLVVVGLLSGRRPEKRLAVERETSPEVFEGDRMRVRLKVSNISRLTVLMASILDLQFEAAPPGTLAERVRRSLAMMHDRWSPAGEERSGAGEPSSDRKGPHTVTVERLGPGESVEADYEIEAKRRGVFTCSQVAIQTADVFGSVIHQRTVTLPSRTIVFPKVYRLDSFTFKPELSALPAELMEWSRKGTGQDYYGVREYVTGDSLRHVHWPSTARRGRLIVKEYQHEFRPPSGVLVYLLPPRYGTVYRNTLEDGLRAAASIVDYYAVMGSLPGLVLPRGEWFEVVDGLSVRELFGALAAYEPPDPGIGATEEWHLAEAMAFTLSKLAPGRVTGIVTNVEVEALARALDAAPMLSGGALVVAPEESYLPGRGSQPAPHLLADLELTCARYGLDAYLLDPEREIDECLSEPLTTTGG